MYQELFDEVVGAENRVTMAQLDYNDAVTEYNTALATFLGGMVGGVFGLAPMQLYSGG